MHTCWLLRKELTEVNRALHEGHCVLALFVGRQLTVHAADITPDAMFTVAFSPHEIDVSREGLPDAKLTMTRNVFDRVFKVILAGKAVGVRQRDQDPDNIEVKQLVNVHKPNLRCSLDTTTA